MMARSARSTDHPETTASVNIGAISYPRAMYRGRVWKSSSAGLRYADAGGRPISNQEFDDAHARVNRTAGRQCRRPSFNEAAVTEVCGGSSIVKFNGEKGLIVTVFLIRIE
jgi:hypothetical protein